ncbi:dienelactone hydrolase family protein [Asticcacaulis machinosus]|uniref:Dienelactone hydrolase family protein n=1 Tax=Asticcacaulis machinosus TaxID=2984211 RepID=A0ABT5HIE6_9CAUL|nr:dienelactone hydrolase family protein [Asticcacaulis machinosus]MDC7675978.1 dienelactone hydrolase family protein [Asticcacaulis machinosus]
MTDETPPFKREVLQLFDQYVHGLISRRGFLEGAAKYTAGAAGAVATLTALSPDFARAQTAADDSRLTTTRVDIASPDGNGTIKAYLIKPAKIKTKLPVVVVVHENRGLNPHIEDIARRVALDGYIALAPDALTTLGGYPGNEDDARALFQKLDQPKTRNDFVAAADYARTLTNSTGKVGVVGFCYGGAIANLLATRIPTLKAAVPFYGSPAPLADVPNIKAELLVHMGGNDARVNATWPDYEAALKAAGVRYEAYIYDNAEHGFNNDTTPRFKPDAAKLAWERTMSLFARTLKGA